MDITWFGLSCFHLKGRSATIITDPYEESSLQQGGRLLQALAADIVTISRDDPDHNNRQAIEGVRKVIRGPGEYEVASVLILGLRTPKEGESDPASLKNTAYIFEIDGLRLCHLGNPDRQSMPGATSPGSPLVTELGRLDLLFIPTGGLDSLDSAQAAEVVRLLEPRIVIPMHFQDPSVSRPLEPVDKFLKELGLRADAIGVQPKLSLTPRTCPMKCR